MMLVFNYTEWSRPLPYFALGYILLKSIQVILLLLPFPHCPGKGGGVTGRGGFLPGIAIPSISELRVLEGCGYTKQTRPKALSEVAGRFSGV